MIADTMLVLLVKLLVVVLGAALLILAAAHWQLLGHFGVDALLGGLIAAALTIVYPPPTAATLLTVILWVAATGLARLLARFRQRLAAPHPPSSSFAYDIDELVDLFEFEEVP